MADLILVNINPAYQLKELHFALNKVECKALITHPQFKSSNYIWMIKELAPEISSSTNG
jgi:fatty-acyl-CoA synthase